jgi:putative transposase
MEELKVKNMSKSASGTVENPGKNIKVKSGLNKSILDQGWFEFRRQLEYKSVCKGGKLLLIPPQYTSLKCSDCGYVAKENRKNQANFKCCNCGFEINADHNAAINILAAGHAVRACGETGNSRLREAGTSSIL